MTQTPWRPRLKSGLKLQVIDGEAIILDRGNERVHQLNEVGTFILERCDGTRTRDDLVTAVVAGYEVSEAEAAADTAGLLTRMKALDILF